MKASHRFVLLAVCAALAVTTAGCWGSRDPAHTIRIGNGAEPEALDPHIVTGIPEHHVLSTLFEGLVRLDEKDLSIVPGVAERWEESEDGLVYTFYLRDDAKWSNGEPLTAQDFAYSWKRILTPSLASEYSYMLYPIKNARAYNTGRIDDFSEVGVEAVDDRTLVVELEHPTPYFLTLHSHYTWFPVPQKTIEQFGAIDDRVSRWTRPGNLVGNGPYVLTEWRPNEVIKVRPNPHYWDAESVLNDGVNFYPVTSNQTEERMFRAGELHITEDVPIQKVPVYQAENPEMIRTDPCIGSYFYRVNVTRKPLNDVRVRKALAMTIDRKAITTHVVQGGETAAHFFTPPGINDYVPSAHVAYNPAKARELLAQAGFPNGKGFPTIDILYNTDEKHKEIAETIQQMWKRELGIDVTLSNQEWKVYLNSTNRLDYDIARAGWIGDVVDPMNFLECFTTGNGNNRTGYSNSEYDAILEQAMSLRENDARNELYDQAESILMDELPLLPIYHYTRPFLIQPNVRGLEQNILAYYSYHKVYLEEFRVEST